MTQLSPTPLTPRCKECGTALELPGVAAELERLERSLAEQQRLVEGLRKTLDGIAWQPGAWSSGSRIEFCRFCSYSRQQVELYGHRDTCPLFVPLDAAIKEKQE